jgi:tetratricopeptide (TPR) repeat protein
MRLWEFFALLISGAIVFAQQAPGGGRGGSAVPPVGTGTNPSPNATNNTNNTCGLNCGPDLSRPIYISGKVSLTDGTPPPEPVRIEKVCNGSPRLAGYTDSKGRFSFDAGRGATMFDPTASAGDAMESNLPGMRGTRSVSRSTGLDTSLLGCELRADLPGYRSDLVSLSSMRSLDNPDVGTIILHRIGNSDGLTISATSGLAPKDARKAFEKALEAESRKKFDEAQADLEKAVGIYPKYAAAWFQLGKLREESRDSAEGRKAYEQALVADAKYLPPLMSLSILSLKESDWTNLEKLTSRLLRLDPLNYPDAYYMNGVANLQLKQFDASEKSLREAIRLDPGKKNLRSYYVLGLAQASQGNFVESAETLRSFLNSSPNIPDVETVRQQLATVEENAKRTATLKSEETNSAPAKSQ